jgi:hypothetical protein
LEGFTVDAQNEVLNFLPSRNGWTFANGLSGTFPVVTLPVIGTIASADAGDGTSGPRQSQLAFHDRL